MPQGESLLRPFHHHSQCLLYRGDEMVAMLEVHIDCVFERSFCRQNSVWTVLYLPRNLFYLFDIVLILCQFYLAC